MLHIRALVRSDAVLLFDTYGSGNSKLQSSFLYHLEVGRRPRTSSTNTDDFRIPISTI